MKTKYIVIGRQGSGKTTFAKYLAEALGTKCTDTSEMLVRIETARMSAIHQTNGGEGAGEQWDADRGRPKRKYLVALGDALKRTDPAYLGRCCFSYGNVCCGVRSGPELQALREEFHGVKVIFIVRPDSEPDPADNFDLTSGHAHYLVYNDSSAANLRVHAEWIADL